MKNPEIISKIVELLRSEPGLILLHHNADIDSIGSALALQAAFPNYSIGANNKISQLSKNFLQNLGYEQTIIDLSPELDKFNIVVILDASSPSQLGITKDELKNPIVIDHHTYNDIWNDAVYYCDETKTSCGEIILDILRFIEFQITPQISLALLGSILVDTGHFKFANKHSLVNFADLMEVGDHSMSDIYNLIDSGQNDDKAQRIAHLKGAQRLRLREIGKYLIAVTQLSSFEASMCKHLLLLGADVAFVGAQRNDEFRISGRATAKLINSGLHLGKLFQTLGSELGCDGGGHAGAAGLNGHGDVEMLLNTCIANLESELKQNLMLT